MTFRIGLIGTATITREWMCNAFRQHPETEVAAVVGSDPARTEAFAEELEIPIWETDIDRFFAENALDAVYIATTNDRHSPQAIAALSAGVHVLCKKPLAVVLEEAQRMVQAAASAGLVLATNHHLRHHASHRAIRKVVQSSALGEMMLSRVSFTSQLPEALARWRMRDPASGAGVVLDLTVRDIDCLRFWFGEDPVRVSGIGQARRGNDILDNVTTVWEFENGALVTCQDSFNVPHGGNAVELHGRAGSLLATNVLSQKAGGQVQVTTNAGKRELTLEHEDAYVLVVEAFLAAIRGEGAPGCSGRDGLMALRCALVAQEAIAAGHTIEISAAD